MLFSSLSKEVSALQLKRVTFSYHSERRRC